MWDLYVDPPLKVLNCRAQPVQNEPHPLPVGFRLLSASDKATFV